MAMRVGELDTPLLQLSVHDMFNLRDACQGVWTCDGFAPVT